MQRKRAWLGIVERDGIGTRVWVRLSGGEGVWGWGAMVQQGICKLRADTVAELRLGSKEKGGAFEEM